MRIYIAGPITGYDLGERLVFFREKRAELDRRGHEGVNPLECHELGIPWEAALKADLQELCRCDAILLTPGWEKSRGARLELHVALELGLKVILDEEAGSCGIPEVSGSIRFSTS